ncbi:MAG: histidine-type phosphatase [Blautia sp.]|nr:histidine-type phosphatase [Blautia sp.]
MNKRIITSILTGTLLLGTVFSTAVMAEAPAADAAAAAEESVSSDYTLAQMVVLSRHNIRSPLSEKGSMISEITPHEWFDWTSNAGELSLRGAMLETTMGQYFRLKLEKEGLFPENYLPKDGAVRFYANALQRTQATAHYFSTGLLPVAVVPVERHEEYNELDATFLPIINFMNEEYAADVSAEIAERGNGEGLAGYRESLDDAFRLIVDVTDMEETEAYADGTYGDLLSDETTLSLEEGKEPGMSGPIKSFTSIADALVLQYYEEPDEVKAAFGHELTEEQWKSIGSVLANYEKILFSSPLLAPNLAHPMLKEFYQELNAQGRQFSFLCGHDSTITAVLAALGVEEYELPGAIEPTTPIGAKFVLERWEDPEGSSWYTASLVYQSTEQLRSIEPLSLENPPMVVPLSFEGIETAENGMIAEEDLLGLFASKIDAFDEIKEEYQEQELADAA